MRNFVLSLLLLFAITLYGQQDVHKGQTFKVSNLKTGFWDEFKFHIGLSLKFDVEFKFPVEDFSNDTYNITAVLKDSLGNTIFDNESINAVLYAKQDKKDGVRYIDRGLYLFIPKTEFKLPWGKNKLKLILNAANGEVKFSAIYDTHIDVFVPKDYDFEEQEFYIHNYVVKEESINGQKGLKIDFATSYKFMSQQIRDFETNENAKYYYFYVEMKDSEGRTVYIPTENTYEGYLTEYEKALAKDENETDKLSLFISYRRLNLNAGHQELNVILNATDMNKTVSFQNLANKKIRIMQPEIYFAELTVSNMTIKYGQYDMSSVLGRMFSKKRKNKGKGYPDVMWRVNTGYDEIYRSGINKNSFSAYDGSFFFRLAEEDPVRLIVEDNDNLVNNDHIETLDLENKTGECKLVHDNLSYGEIESVNLIFQKSYIPKLINKKISVSESKRQEVTGYDFVIQYETQYLNEKYPLELVPFYIDNNNGKNYIQHLRIINDETLNKPGQIIINAEGLLKMFIPAYGLKNKCSLGYETKIMDIEAGTYIQSDELEIDDVNDVKFKINEIKDIKREGVYGVLVDVGYDIPGMYLYDIGFDQIDLAADFLAKNKKESLNQIVRKLTSFSSEIQGSGYFIPYYRIADFHEKLDVEIGFQAKHDDMIIGKDQKIFSIPETGLANVFINNFLLKYKSKSDFYTEMKVRVLHDGKEIGTTESQIFEKKMWFGNVIPMKKSVHPNDDLVIQLIGESKFESEEIIEEWIIEAIKFTDKKVKLPKKGGVKKMMINL